MADIIKFEETVSYLLAKVTTAFRNSLERHMGQIGLHGGQIFVLFELSFHCPCQLLVTRSREEQAKQNPGLPAVPWQGVRSPGTGGSELRPADSRRFRKKPRGP